MQSEERVKMLNKKNKRCFKRRQLRLSRQRTPLPVNAVHVPDTV